MYEIARRLDLNTVQVTETLVYYSMLRRKPLGKYHVQICTNVSCMLQGGYGLLEHAKRRLEIGHKEVTQDGVFSLEEVECLGACTGAPCMQVNYDYFENLTTEAFDRIIEYLDLGRNPEPVQVISGALHPRHPAETPLISKLWGIRDSHKIDVYVQHEGYAGLKKAVTEMTPDAIIEEVKTSNLRGRGGAGFPTGMKWSFVPKDSPKPKYVICNADESEPGTCKDRPLMEMDPHQLIEGIIIAGRAINAHQGFIYIRGEYRYVLNIVERAIEEAYSRGYLGQNILGSGFDFDLLIHTGAGAATHASSRRFRPSSDCMGVRRSSTTLRRSAQCPRSSAKAAKPTPIAARARTAGRGWSAFRAISASRASTKFPSAST